MTDRIAILGPEIHPPFNEGIQKSAWGIAQELAKNKQAVLVLTQCSYGEKITDSLNPEIVYSINSQRWRLLKYGQWLFDGWRIARRLQREKFTHLLVFSLDWSFLSPLFWTMIINRSLKINLIIFSTRELDGLGILFLRLFKNRFSNLFPRSSHLAERLKESGVAAERIAVVTTFPSKDQYLAPLAINNSNQLKTIAYLSNPEKSAGIYTVLAAAHACPEINFIIAIRHFAQREEEAVTKILAKIGKLKLDNLTVIRNIDKMVNFYKTIDAVIVPPLESRQTMAAPLVFLEALAAGKTVFLSSLPLFKEYEKLGIIFKDEADLIAQIKYYHATPDLLASFHKLGADYIKQLPDLIGAAKIYQQ